MNDFIIHKLAAVTPAVVEAFARLVPQLSDHASPPGPEQLQAVVDDCRARLYVAETSDGNIVGTLTLVLYDIPTGRRAWIEDVVVDNAWRGKGCAEAMVRHAIRDAASAGAGKLMLTSNPRRLAAHALYSKAGFEVYDTAVFRITPR